MSFLKNFREKNPDFKGNDFKILQVETLIEKYQSFFEKNTKITREFLNDLNAIMISENKEGFNPFFIREFWIDIYPVGPINLKKRKKNMSKKGKPTTIIRVLSAIKPAVLEANRKLVEFIERFPSTLSMNTPLDHQERRLQRELRTKIPAFIRKVEVTGMFEILKMHLLSQENYSRFIIALLEEEKAKQLLDLTEENTRLKKQIQTLERENKKKS